MFRPALQQRRGIALPLKCSEMQKGEFLAGPRSLPEVREASIEMNVLKESESPDSTLPNTYELSAAIPSPLPRFRPEKTRAASEGTALSTGCAEEARERRIS